MKLKEGSGTEAFAYYVGVDLGSQQHQVCIVATAGAVVAEFQVVHSGTGMGALADRLGDLRPGSPERVAVAIEIPMGAVVETLLERGHAVFGIKPRQLGPFRDRYSPSGATDDRRDAMVAARSLRTDRR